MNTMDQIIDLNYPENTLVKDEKPVEKWTWEDFIRFLEVSRGCDEDEKEDSSLS
jgi:hypothetical protein